jgi:uncharacterized protein YcgI (DUF1989 family)
MSLDRELIRPGEFVVLNLDFAQRLTITDVSGGQFVHLVCINHGDQRERFSAANTMLLNKGVRFGEGDALHSYYCHGLMTIVGSRPGAHDTLPGPVVDGKAEDVAAKDALAKALGTIGLRASQVPFPFQLFAHHTVAENGSIGPRTATSEPGDVVELRAELDLVVVLVHAGSRTEAAPLTYEVLTPPNESGDHA